MLPYITDLLKRPETHKVLSTSSPDGVPHTIVCGSIVVPSPSTLAVGEVYMYTTSQNLKANGRAEVLVWSGKTAYAIQVQVRCREESGPELDKMNQNLSKMNVSASAVWIFDVLSVTNEGMGAEAGSKVQ